jgi:hypothetical protein
MLSPVIVAPMLAIAGGAGIPESKIETGEAHRGSKSKMGDSLAKARQAIFSKLTR